MRAYFAEKKKEQEENFSYGFRKMTVKEGKRCGKQRSASMRECVSAFASGLQGIQQKERGKKILFTIIINDNELLPSSNTTLYCSENRKTKAPKGSTLFFGSILNVIEILIQNSFIFCMIDQI
jgi:hypothetical protein